MADPKRALAQIRRTRPQSPETRKLVYMAIQRTGGCLCGAIRYESDGDVMFALRCHCRDCQRQSGAASVAAIRVPAARFHVTKGTPKRFVAQAWDSGNEIARAFCGDCRDPALCPGGYLTRCGRAARLHARRSRMVPSGSRYFCQKRAASWEPVDAAKPQYPEYPPGKVLIRRRPAQ